ncbi:hypothetical protein [Colwellia sp. MEBiC06753]
MSLVLPIVISAEQGICQQLGLTSAMLEKLEAWANFETLKANWYHDETQSIRCQFTFVSSELFAKKFSQTSLADWQIDQEQQVALKVGDIQTKQQIVLTLTEDDLAAKTATSTWIGEHIQANIQQKVREHLLYLAQFHQLDPID